MKNKTISHLQLLRLPIALQRGMALAPDFEGLDRVTVTDFVEKLYSAARNIALEDEHLKPGATSMNIQEDALNALGDMIMSAVHATSIFKN